MPNSMAGELWHLLLRGDHSSHLGLWVAVGPVQLGPPSLITVETDTDLTVNTSLEQLCSICSRLSPSSWLCLTLAAPWHLGLPELLGCPEQSLPAYVECACVLRPTAYLFTREGMAFWKGSNFLNNQSNISLALARHGVSREVPCSALKGETVPDVLILMKGLLVLTLT